jgi:hypothetical protein
MRAIGVDHVYAALTDLLTRRNGSVPHSCHKKGLELNDHMG